MRSSKNASVLNAAVGDVTIKALSIHQPWANEIADGKKTIETRYWSTSYRGPLLICSTKRYDIEPRGCAVAIVQMVDCRPMAEADEDAARCGCDGNEIAWVFADVRKIAPFPVRGQRKLYDVTLPENVFVGDVLTASFPSGWCRGDCSKPAPPFCIESYREKQMTRIARRLLVVAMLFVGGCLMGCAAIPKTFDEALEAAGKAAQIASEHDVAYVARVEWDGQVRGTLGWTGVVDSGVRVSFTFFGNAKAAEAE